MYKLIFVVFLIFCNVNRPFAAGLYQLDSVPKLTKKIDSNHSPKIAMRRSLMLPGWGQVYNKQTWKVPIVYAGLGITAYIFFDNIKTYNDLRRSFNAKYNARVNGDSSGLPGIPAYLSGLDESGLALNRRRYRQQVDYSVLFFIAFWGLNVADAVVFAHLKNFDVSDNISGHVSLGNSNIANTNGIQLNFDIHKKKTKGKHFLVK